MSKPPPLEEIIARAKSGDGKAQYVLAAALSRAGKRDEAESWLQAAAKSGEPDALYTLATRELQSFKGAGKAALLLSRAAEGGSALAARLLAVLRAEGYGVPEDWNGAVASVLALAKKGDPASLREIAALLILGNPESPQGAALLEAAAEKDVIAAAVCVIRRIAGRNFGSAAMVAHAHRRLEDVQYPRAQLLKERSAATDEGERPPAVDWREISAELLAAPAFRPAGQRLLNEPDVSLFTEAVPVELLEYVIAQSAPRLAPSTTVDSRDGAVRRDAYRTSLTATLGPVDQDLTTVAINRRIANLAGADHRCAEFLSVLCYAPGQEYRPHFDWLPPGADFDRGGQRVTTALLYLNDDYKGGETHFLKPDFKVRGKPGDLLVFANVLKDGSGDTASRHAGLAVAEGRKWLGSKWFRERPYEF